MAFPALAGPITIPVVKLTSEAAADAGLTGADYAVIEPTSDGAQVRAASVEEALEYERARGLGRVTHSLDELFTELESDVS